MNDADQAEFLKLVRNGHDPEAAVVALDLDMSVLNDPELKPGIQEALRIGTARLRSKIMQLALDSNDVRALTQLLDRREALEVDGIARIERVILGGKCKACGHRSGLPLDNVGNKELARRLAFVIAQGADLSESSPSTKGNGQAHG